MSIPALPRETLPREAVAELFHAYGDALDTRDYAAWFALFAEECSYRVLPLENVSLGLPVALIACENRRMLADRISSLSQTAKFDLRQSRHVIGAHSLRRADDGVLHAAANFAVYQTDDEGRSALFVVGRYSARLLPDGSRIADMAVILDTSNIPSMLATPL